MSRAEVIETPNDVRKIELSEQQVTVLIQNVVNFLRKNPTIRFDRVELERDRAGTYWFNNYYLHKNTPE